MNDAKQTNCSIYQYILTAGKSSVDYSEHVQYLSENRFSPNIVQNIMLDVINNEDILYVVNEHIENLLWNNISYVLNYNECYDVCDAIKGIMSGDYSRAIHSICNEYLAPQEYNVRAVYLEELGHYLYDEY